MGVMLAKKIIVPAHADYLPALRNFILKTGEKYNFTQHEINAFRISIDEAVTNIIKHGYRNRVGSITMKVHISENCLVVELIDQGKSFDPNIIDNPNISQYIEKGKKGGLGIFIMRKFLDKIEYEVTKIGNVLRLVKMREREVALPFLLPITFAIKRWKERLFKTADYANYAN